MALLSSILILTAITTSNPIPQTAKQEPKPKTGLGSPTKDYEGLLGPVWNLPWV